MKNRLYSFIMTCCLCIGAWAQDTDSTLDARWKKSFTSAQQIEDTYKLGTELTGNLKTRNTCWLVCQAADYVLAHEGKEAGTQQLLTSIPYLPLDGRIISAFAPSPDHGLEQLIMKHLNH